MKTELPDDLANIERQLAGRAMTAPPDELRRRVLGAVREELRTGRRPGRWTFAAAAAAACLVWCNLSLCAAQSTDLRLGPRTTAAKVDSLAAEIQQLAPDLSRHDAVRLAVLGQSGARLATCPEPQPAGAGEVEFERAFLEGS